MLFSAALFPGILRKKITKKENRKPNVSLRCSVIRKIKSEVKQKRVKSPIISRFLYKNQPWVLLYNLNEGLT